MLNESVGNITFRNIPAEKKVGPRVGLRIGGIGLTIQQNTWNDLVRLARNIGEIRPNEAVVADEMVEAEEIIEVEEEE